MPKQNLKDEFNALLNIPSVSAATRRTTLKAVLGLGYAAAVMPVWAQTAVHTPADGLVAGEISYEVGGFQVNAYRAAPAGKSNLPVVLLIHEIFGVHEYIADTARRLAHQGYMVIAPQLFGRQGDVSGLADIGQIITQVVSKVPDAQVMADLDGAAAWAGANGGDLSRLGVTGFCWGGRQTWLYAAHNKQVSAAVAWYGRLMGIPSTLMPLHPNDLTAQLAGPVLGLYAGKDQGISLNTVERMRKALAAGNSAAKSSQIVIYPDAPHAFHADYRDSYRKDAAQDGWKRMLRWLSAYGV